MSFIGEVEVTIGVDTTVVGFRSVIDQNVAILGDFEVIFSVPINFILEEDTSCAVGPVDDV